MRFDATTAEVLVFSYKEGLLSRVAHDLKFKIGSFGVHLEGQSVTATFDTSSLKVIAAQRDGRDAPGALPHFTFPEIERNAARDVLGSALHPEARFVSTEVTPTELVGQFFLHGHTRELRLARTDTPSAWGAEVVIDQRDFGIKPFTAMLGTLKVKPQVKIVVRIPRPA